MEVTADRSMTKWVLSSCRAWVSALLSRGRVFQVTAPVTVHAVVLGWRRLKVTVRAGVAKYADEMRGDQSSWIKGSNSCPTMCWEELYRIHKTTVTEGDRFAMQFTTRRTLRQHAISLRVQVHGQFPVFNHRPRNFAGSVTLCSQSAIPRYGSDSCSWQGHDRLARWQRSSTLGCSTVAATREARPSLAPSRPSVDPYPRLMSSSARVRAVDRPGPPNRPGLEPMSDIPVDVFPEPNRREVGCGYETRASTFLRAAGLHVFG